VGSIEKGKIADIIVINMSKPHLSPLYNAYSHIVYAAMASDVETVMVNGKIVVDETHLTTADEAEILHKAKKWSDKICGN
jgi:5-methylthioadenosine/S-adenosylhomocysteine deaminase